MGRDIFCFSTYFCFLEETMYGYLIRALQHFWFTEFLHNKKQDVTDDLDRCFPHSNHLVNLRYKLAKPDPRLVISSYFILSENILISSDYAVAEMITWNQLVQLFFSFLLTKKKTILSISRPKENSIALLNSKPH